MLFIISIFPFIFGPGSSPVREPDKRSRAGRPESVLVKKKNQKLKFFFTHKLNACVEKVDLSLSHKYAEKSKKVGGLSLQRRQVI